MKHLKGLLCSLVYSLPVAFGTYWFLNQVHEIQSPQIPMGIAVVLFCVISLWGLIRPTGFIHSVKSLWIALAILNGL
ncbi:hypothetical protein GCM10007876_31100 [Litoribrevibacter albus]|uniref:Uncharacterized protein n=1 Tax=Litoribrevibacter albus TaxID=1473156 RepID=A0AA37SDU2_9GAMM|nr:hypothetical protein GCM10007876_31100 [Litoribrevibacter albus]